MLGVVASCTHLALKECSSSEGLYIVVQVPGLWLLTFRATQDVLVERERTNADVVYSKIFFVTHYIITLLLFYIIIIFIMV